MFKQFMFTLIVVLFASHAAFATIDQMQDFMVGTTNLINLVHGDQTANAIQNVFVGEDQNANQGHGAFARQGYTGILHQVGRARGNSALILVSQVFNVLGFQGQLVGGHVGLIFQSQGLGLFAGTNLARADGGGNAVANTMYLGNERQFGTNVGATAREATNVSIQQHADIQGQPGSTGSVIATMTVGTNQLQAITP